MSCYEYIFSKSAFCTCATLSLRLKSQSPAQVHKLRHVIRSLNSGKCRQLQTKIVSNETGHGFFITACGYICLAGKNYCLEVKSTKKQITHLLQCV